MNDYLPYETQICEPLTRRFGADFGLMQTGGGCVAIQATLENGDTLLITDAEDTLSPWHVRQRCYNNDGECLGYSVGYYAGGEECRALVKFAKARDAAAVQIAVITAINLARTRAQPGEAVQVSLTSNGIAYRK